MRFLELDQVISKTTMSRSYILAGKGGFPAGIKIQGRRELVWVEQEIDAWMVDQVDRARAAA